MMAVCVHCTDFSSDVDLNLVLTTQESLCFVKEQVQKQFNTKLKVQSNVVRYEI